MTPEELERRITRGTEAARELRRVEATLDYLEAMTVANLQAMVQDERGALLCACRLWSIAQLRAGLRAMAADGSGAEELVARMQESRSKQGEDEDVDVFAADYQARAAAARAAVKAG